MQHDMIDIDTTGLAWDKIALFLDIDGTLIDLAPKPDKVVVPSTLVNDLSAMYARLGGALALVSGRRIVEIDHLFKPLMLPASGVHGSEFRSEPDGAVRHFAPPLPDAIRKSAADIVSAFPGALFEDKGVAIAVHWRLCPDSGPAIMAEIAELMKAAPLNLVMLHGHCVLEIKAGSVDKGIAVARFLERAPFAGRQPMFIGDDVTDQAAFATVRQLGGRALSVGRLIEGATDYFADPLAVRRWLSRIVAQIQTPAMA
jgi:trehalose 6-phosphate phosphatase